MMGEPVLKWATPWRSSHCWWSEQGHCSHSACFCNQASYQGPVSCWPYSAGEGGLQLHPQPGPRQFPRCCCSRARTPLCKGSCQLKPAVTLSETPVGFRAVCCYSNSQQVEWQGGRSTGGPGAHTQVKEWHEWGRKCKNSSVLQRDYAGLPTGFPLSAVVIGMYSLQSLLGPGATCYWTGQLIYFFVF